MSFNSRLQDNRISRITGKWLYVILPLRDIRTPLYFLKKCLCFSHRKPGKGHDLRSGENIFYFSHELWRGHKDEQSISP